MNLFIYILLIILIVVLLIYLICFNQIENNLKLGYWFKGTKLRTNLDLDNIIINEIAIIKTNTEIINFITKTLCHYDVMVKDINNNYYVYYVYHDNDLSHDNDLTNDSNHTHVNKQTKDGDYYNRYIQIINTNEIKNNKFKIKHFDDSWTYKISSKKYNINPISLKRIDSINEKLFEFGYHLSKFNCQHRIKMLINILTDKQIYDIHNYSIFKTPYKILVESFSKTLK